MDERYGAKVTITWLSGRAGERSIVRPQCGSGRHACSWGNPSLGVSLYNLLRFTFELCTIYLRRVWKFIPASVYLDVMYIQPVFAWMKSCRHHLLRGQSYVSLAGFELVWDGLGGGFG